MSTTGRISAGAAILIFAVALFLTPTSAHADCDGVCSVTVTNFPSVQEVEGRVRIIDPIPQTKTTRLKDVLVPPVKRQNTTSLVQAGTLTTAGFKGLVLSMTGETRGEVVGAGDIGVILVPDEKPIVELLEKKGILQFPLELVAPGITNATPYFNSEQLAAMIAFPRYRVLMYNTTNKSVSVDLYAYLTN